VRPKALKAALKVAPENFRIVDNRIDMKMRVRQCIHAILINGGEISALR